MPIRVTMLKKVTTLNVAVLFSFEVVRVRVRVAMTLTRFLEYRTTYKNKYQEREV